MKITILGSCRQDSLYNKNYEITKIRDEVSYPHYTKEMLELIRFIKYDTILPEETLYTFRSPIITKVPVYSYNYKNDFETSNIFIIEISSKIKYKYKNNYVHHILYDNLEFKIENTNDIEKSIQSDEEIEEDILNIVKELGKNKIIIVGHIVTYESGERYNLLKLLENICCKNNILFIDPIKEFTKKGYDINNLMVKEDISVHYNELGHHIIGSIYDEYISKLQ